MHASTSRSHATLAILVLAAVGTTGAACDIKISTGTDDDVFPELTDTIPFDALGGGRIAFHRTGPSEDYAGIYVVDLDTRGVWGFVPQDGLGDDFVFVEGPVLAPDGGDIAFEGDNRIWVGDAHAWTITPLSPDSVVNVGVPAWSMDGKCFTTSMRST